MASVGKVPLKIPRIVNETVSRSVSVSLQTLLGTSFLATSRTGGPSPSMQKLVMAGNGSVGIPPSSR